jgi:hypothetical protein
VKTLIANAPAKVAGLPAADTRMGPPLLRPPIDGSTQRNAIGIALPGARLPGYDRAGVTTGTRPTGIGTASVNVGNPTNKMRTPTNAGPALHGTAINGTTMGRVAAGAGSIGGPARDRSGINGTLMRPKH